MPEPRELRTSQSQFRRAGGGREPLAPYSGDTHIHYTPRHQGFGVVLSRPATGVAGCDCWACKRGYVIDHSKLGKK